MTHELQSGFCTGLHVFNCSICVFFFLFGGTRSGHECGEKKRQGLQGEKETDGLQRLELNEGCQLGEMVRTSHTGWMLGKQVFSRSEWGVSEWGEGEEGGALVFKVKLFTTWGKRIEDCDTRNSATE